MSQIGMVGSAQTASSCFPVTGDRIRVARGVLGRLGRVGSTSPGHVVVHYDDGGREIVDPSRRPLFVLR